MDFCHVAKRNGGRMPAKGKCAPDKSCGQARSRHVSPGRVMGNDVADKQNGRTNQVAPGGIGQSSVDRGLEGNEKIKGRDVIKF